MLIFFSFFFWDFGPCQLTSFISIPSYEAGIYKPTVLQVPLAGLQHMQQCQVGWNIPLSIFALHYWSKWKVRRKIVSSIGGLNSWPLSHESSALTTRLMATRQYFSKVYRRHSWFNVSLNFICITAMLYCLSFILYKHIFNLDFELMSSSSPLIWV